MNYFRKLPLPGKLFLLVLFPMLLIVFLTIRVYRDNNERVEMIGGYVQHIRLFRDLSAAAIQLQIENRKSFVYSLKKDTSSYREVLAVRPVTDSVLAVLDKSPSPIVRNYRKYTFLEGLPGMRNAIDTNPVSNEIMHFFTTSMFRIKTLAQGASVSNRLLDTVYNDLNSARILNDMFMYLGIIRANFYGALLKKENNIPMLYGLRGSYDMLKSYDQELYYKSTGTTISNFERWKSREDVAKTLGYIDRIFARGSFDSLYDADEWWRVSGSANDNLRKMQQEIVLHSMEHMEDQYRDETRKRDGDLFFMGLALLGVLAIMFITSKVIHGMLHRLDDAAQKIAVGEEGPVLPDKPRDVIGRLATSIEKIDSNNKSLAFAAAQIGKGDFSVDVRPRGQKDALGLAVAEMKDDLQAYINEIREHERRKDDFIVMASHELKTPITSIKGYVQLLFALYHEYERTRVLPSDESVRSSLTTIDKQINKLTRLLSELLDLSRIERGRLELNKVDFNLDELIRETIDEVRHTATGREIIYSKGDRDLVITADRDRIGQVMLNLLTNALKYSKPSEPVKVEMCRNENEVTVTVIDKGIGIPEAAQQKIFERFYRVEGSSEQTYPGFGIGLYIANEIVQRHGGRMFVRSVKGEGSEVGFILLID